MVAKATTHSWTFGAESGVRPGVPQHSVFAS
eukprot:COSAG02_NODE_54994_length_293_cov_0.680412_1_plen_30_part_01